jgi:hypothetical protein
VNNPVRAANGAIEPVSLVSGSSPARRAELTRSSSARILALALAYRDFALANPALYALMFERPLPTFDPSHQARAEALGMTFTLLTDELAGAVRSAYLIWTAIHGIVSIELTHAVRSPLPGWFIDSPEVGAQVLREGVQALLTGLSSM